MRSCRALDRRRRTIGRVARACVPDGKPSLNGTAQQTFEDAGIAGLGFTSYGPGGVTRRQTARLLSVLLPPRSTGRFLPYGWVVWRPSVRPASYRSRVPRGLGVV